MGVVYEAKDLKPHQHVALKFHPRRWRTIPRTADAIGIYPGLGEKDKAFEWLEKGYDERSLLHIKVDPGYDPLRSDPRFTNILHRMNLAP